MINERLLYPHKQMMMIMPLYIQNFMIIEDVYFVKQIFY